MLKAEYCTADSRCQWHNVYNLPRSYLYIRTEVTTLTAGAKIKVDFFIARNQGGVTMAKVEQKQVVVNQIKEKLNGASSVLLVDYRGLTVEQDTKLRKELREAGVEYKVYKNTMVNFAIEGTEFAEISKDLEGPTAIAISYEDATAGPRILAKVAKENDKLEFKSGVVEGTYYDAKGMMAIGNIAPREELLGRLLGSFKSPIASFARVIKQVAEKEA